MNEAENGAERVEKQVSGAVNGTDEKKKGTTAELGAGFMSGSGAVTCSGIYHLPDSGHFINLYFMVTPIGSIVALLQRGIFAENFNTSKGRITEH
jgi:hypothetical protein